MYVYMYFVLSFFPTRRHRRSQGVHERRENFFGRTLYGRLIVHHLREVSAPPGRTRSRFFLLLVSMGAVNLVVSFKHVF